MSCNCQISPLERPNPTGSVYSLPQCWVFSSKEFQEAIWTESRTMATKQSVPSISPANQPLELLDPLGLSSTFLSSLCPFSQSKQLLSLTCTQTNPTSVYSHLGLCLLVCYRSKGAVFKHKRKSKHHIYIFTRVLFLHQGQIILHSVYVQITSQAINNQSIPWIQRVSWDPNFSTHYLIKFP